MYENPEVWTGDCLELFPKLVELPRLVVADPPFGIGQDYQDYDDTLSPEAYADFTYDWIRAASTTLAADGTLCVHVPDQWVALVEGAASARQLTRVDWIVWHFRFGMCTTHKLITSKAHCLVYAKDKENRCWNPNAILVESDRSSVYKDARTKSSKTPGRRVPFDVWGPWEGPHWGRVTGAHSNKERRPNHPNQLPEKYLERILLAFSDPGDLVCDPFTGSGGTAVVSDALGRRFIGFEISPASADSARQRIRDGAVRVRKVNTCAT